MTGTGGTEEVVHCEQCGTANQAGESFCEHCGAYLEWEEQPERTGPTPPDPVAEPTPVEGDTVRGRRSVIERVKGLAGGNQSSREPGDPTDLDEPALPLPQPSLPVVPSEVAPSSLAKPTTTVPFPDAPTAPRSTTQGPAAPVRPGAAPHHPRRRELPAEDRRPLPGESVCPECGAGNIATRKFCRRCGADVVEAPTVPVLPWYRRLLQRRPRQGPVAGSRPRVRRSAHGSRRWVRVVGLLAALLALGWFARPYLVRTVDLARDRVSNQIVRPAGFTASSAAPGHPARLVGDGAPNQYWSPDVSGAAKGQYVTLTLSKPVRLAYVKVYNGSSSEPGKAYLATARVETLQLTIRRADGGIDNRTILLKDSPGQQDFHIGVSDVTSVRFTIESAFGAAVDRRLAFGEVELFKRS